MNEILTELDDHDRVQDGPAFPDWPALPRLSPQGENEPIAYYGFRVLTFILETNVTATLTDVDLKLAEIAAHRAVAGPLCETARARIVDVKRMIMAVIAVRDRLHGTVGVPLPAAVLDEDKPNLGPMAPLEPVPVNRPPAPSRVSVEF